MENQKEQTQQEKPAETTTEKPANNADASKVEGQQGEKPQGEAAAKTEGEKPAAKEGGEAKADEAAKADKKDSDPEGKELKPVTAEDLKLPEGSPLDKGAVESMVSFAKEHQLSPAAAQSLLDRESKAVSDFRKAQDDAYQKEVDGWIKAARDDKEIGGEGYEKNVELAKRVLKRFGGDEFGQELDRTKLGNNTHLLRFCVRIGKQMAEDDFVSAPKNSGVAREKEPHEKLWPSEKETK
jgi:hypothetical protein